MSTKTEHAQRACNAFTRANLVDVAPLRVDGDKGHATNKRIRQCKYWLGYVSDNQTRKAGDKFLARLANPNSTKLATKKAIARGKKRRKAQAKDARANKDKARKTTGVGTFDGRPCANVAIGYLKWAREHGWQGTLTSGWRDPEYSRQLCRNMCGADSCPGKCAGTSSNHVGSTPERFAVDVSDYARFGQLMKSCPLKPRIYCALGPRDPVHHSPNGH